MLNNEMYSKCRDKSAHVQTVLYTKITINKAFFSNISIATWAHQKEPNFQTSASMEDVSVFIFLSESCQLVLKELYLGSPLKTEIRLPTVRFEFLLEKDQ